jgi:hypothetical protein
MRSIPPHRSRAVAAAAGAAVMALIAGCSGGSSNAGTKASPADLLTSARASLAATNSVHFTLTSSDVPPNGTRLVSGEGVLARPQQFQGKLSILLNGNTVSVELVSVGGKVYAKLPFSSGFQVTNPDDFGLADPATFINPTTGVARMFSELTNVTNKGEVRVGNDVVTQLNGTLPGSVVDSLLADADPAQSVPTELYITKSTNQLRRVVLTGPFYEKGKNSTFNLLMDKYGAPVTITAPSGG